MVGDSVAVAHDAKGSPSIRVVEESPAARGQAFSLNVMRRRSIAETVENGPYGDYLPRVQSASGASPAMGAVSLPAPVSLPFAPGDRWCRCSQWRAACAPATLVAWRSASRSA